jgi:hypothetical protein
VTAGRIGADPRFARALGGAVAHLDAVRIAERRALARATSPDARAGHAEVLASALATASAQVGGIAAGVRERTLQRRLIAAFGRARDAYVLVGAALRARDRSGYLAAANQVTTAERQADVALRALTRLGYSVRG